MAAPKTKKVKVRFDGDTAAEEFEIRFADVKVAPDGSRIITEIPPGIITFKKGETKELDKEVFDDLVSRGLARTKTDMKEREALLNSGRKLYEMSDEERALILNDLPYEI